MEKLKSTKILILIIIITVVLVYAQSLNFDFVNYDDYDLVYENSSFLSDPSNILKSFTSHAFIGKREEGVYYRPLLQISYIIDYRLWKLNPLGYHATNILLHCLAAIILFLFLNILTEEKFVAYTGAMIFALHPIQIESVGWIAGRNDILLGMFIILMIFFFAKHYIYPQSRSLFYILSVISFVGALFTKESAAFYLLLIPAYHLLFSNKTRIIIEKQIFLKTLPFIVVLFCYLLIRHSIFGEFIGSEKLYGKLSTSARIQLVPAMLSEHLKLLILPINLSVEHPLDKLIWFEQPWEIISYIITIGILVTYFILIKINRVMSFVFTWLLVGLLPLLNIIPVAVPILEHRLYAASAGFAFLIPYTLHILSKEKYEKYFNAFLILIVILYAIGTFTRLPVWKNSESLWLDAIKKAPTAHRSYYNLAGYYYDRQEYNKSIPLLEKYLELKPGDFIGYSKLRQTYFMIGNYEKTVEICRRMIDLDPKSQNRHYDLGIFFEKINMIDSAINFYRDVLSHNPGFYKILDHLGTLFLKKDLPDSAEKYFNSAIEINHEYTPSYFNLGTLYYRQGRDSMALSIIRAGMVYGDAPENIRIILNKLQTTNR